MFLFGYSDTPQAREDYQVRQREIEDARLKKFNASEKITTGLGLSLFAAYGAVVGLEITNTNPTYLNSILNLGQASLCGLTMLRTLPSIIRFNRASEKIRQLESPLAGFTA